MQRSASEWLALARECRLRRDYSEALQALIAGQSAAANSLDAAVMAADLLMTLGRVQEAVRILRAGIQLQPRDYPVQSHHLLASLYCGSGLHSSREHRRWGQGFAPAPPVHPAAPSRRIRIGYLSSCFRVDPEAFFTRALIEGHDRSRFEVFCYAAGPPGDAWTRRIRKAADHWIDLGRGSDEDAVRRVRRDRLDILADLSGHFGNGRPAVLAARAAPVQVSLSLYPATLGLSTVEHRITDRLADPPGRTESLYTEKLVRLDRCFCCYSPPENAPPVGPSPALRDGRVTFGVFSRPAKITPRMLTLWAEILRRTPGSRLLFHYSFNGERPVRKEFTEPPRQAMARRGIDPHRLEFIGLMTPHERHLDLHNRVDLMLDTFPFAGMTTTCESLWMGVPVVTLSGTCRLSRAGVSLLSAVGLEDWIAATPAQYVRIAARQAADPAALARLRSTLRERMSRSPLTDAAGHVRELERAYLSLLGRSSS